jgi:hypothetical protein
MISEKATNLNQEINFSNLQNNLSKYSKTSESPSAPIVQQEVASQAPLPSVQQKHSFLSSIRTTLSAPFSSSQSSKLINDSNNTVKDFNLEKIKQVNKVQYPKLNWNKNALDVPNENLSSITSLISSLDLKIDKELMRFFENDSLCKELEVYYKCKQISTEQFLHIIHEFIELHSNLTEFQFSTSPKSLNHSRHEFFILVKDYYEARKMVLKCERHINKFKWTTIANQLKSIWSFEKYTIESSDQCGDQQRCKHELTSEKAYLNEVELNKLKSILLELRFNLIKNGLVSSQFCTKLAKFKLESYLKDFVVKFQSNQQYSDLNNQLKILIDICFFFYRKQNKIQQIENSVACSKSKTFTSKNTSNIYSEIGTEEELSEVEKSTTEENKKINNDEVEEEAGHNNRDDDEEEDEEDDFKYFDLLFKNDIIEWLKSLCGLLLNQSEQSRIESLIRNTIDNAQMIYDYSSIHFENLFFVVQHLLRSPDALKFSFLIQLPFIEVPQSDSYNTAANNLQLHKQLNLNNFKSDQLINFYFDFYLKFFASFSFNVKYRREFLFFNDKNLKNVNKSSDKNNSNVKSNFSPDNQLNCDLFDDQNEETNKPAQNNLWEFVNLEGDLESIESVLIDINEDDLIKLYYQIPFNKLFSFLWTYLEFQEQTNHFSKSKQKNTFIVMQIIINML